MDSQRPPSFEGKWVIINGTGALAGIEGEGTYTGYFTADDRLHVDWKALARGLKVLSRNPQSEQNRERSRTFAALSALVRGGGS